MLYEKLVKIIYGVDETKKKPVKEEERSLLEKPKK